jgi:hypothetical protein
MIRMRRKAPGEHVERLDGGTFHRDAVVLARQAARWARDHIDKLQHAPFPKIPKGLHNRVVDCWLPLLAIADWIGKPWAAVARKAALALSPNDADAGSQSVQLLADIRTIFHERATDQIFSEDLVKELGQMEDRRWPEWRNGKPITKNQMAGILRKFKIGPRTIRIKDQTNKGYVRDWFKEAFLCYLASNEGDPEEKAI